jgi:hypothetical protein
MNNVVLRTIPLAAAFQPLSGKKIEVASVDITAPPSNQHPVIFQGDDGSEVAWIPGEYHIFWRVNLGEIRVRGAPGDVLTLVGGTW